MEHEEKDVVYIQSGTGNRGCSWREAVREQMVFSQCDRKIHDALHLHSDKLKGLRRLDGVRQFVISTFLDQDLSRDTTTKFHKSHFPLDRPQLQCLCRASSSPVSISAVSFSLLHLQAFSFYCGANGCGVWEDVKSVNGVSHVSDESQPTCTVHVKWI